MPKSIVAVLLLLAGAAATFGQELTVRKVDVLSSEVFVLPFEADSGVTADQNGVAFDISTADGLRTYRATYQGRTYTTHVDALGAPKRVAFDLTERRFRVISRTLRLELDDYGLLQPLLSEVGAVSGKAYPHLGFALIRLPRNLDPLAVVARLAQRAGVREASLQFVKERPRPIGQGGNSAPRFAPTAKSDAQDVSLQVVGEHPRPTGRRRNGTPGFAPTNKSDLKADIYVLIDGIRVDEEAQTTFEIIVVNFGAVNSSPAPLHLWIGTDPSFVETVRRTFRVIPALTPKDIYMVSIPQSLLDLTPGRTYYAVAAMAEQGTEMTGRAYTNEDVAGFRLDAAGRIQVGCVEPGRGGRPGVVDPLYRHQWHLRNTGQAAYASEGGTRNQDLRLGNILSRGPRGTGVRVAVVDTGLEVCHPDLVANVEPDASFNFNAIGGDSPAWWASELSDPFNPSPTGDHGTSVAGLIAAEAANGIGGRGVAPGVRLRGYNMLNALDSDLGTVLDALGASDFLPDSADVDVFNMSFGSFGLPTNAMPEEEALFAYGTRRLRNRLGAIYVKSAGNGFNECRALREPVNSRIGCVGANGDDFNNLPYVIVVGGLDATGVRASYASAGANLWVSAPAGEYGYSSPAMITTDQLGQEAGYDAIYGGPLTEQTSVNPHGDYMSTFNGTSSSAPNVSGVVAVLLDAEPELTWRDVKHVLASTARRVDPSVAQVAQRFGGTSRVVQHRWITNGAGYNFHNWYGFGGVHAARALSLARRHAPNSLGRFRRSGWFNSGGGDPADIPDADGQGVTQRLTVAGLPTFASIEAVVVEVDIDHPFPHDLAIQLSSPDGTPSIVNPVFNEVLAIDNDGVTLRWRLLSNAFYGENPNGTWRLLVYDGAEGDTGALNHWRLRFYFGEHPRPTD